MPRYYLHIRKGEGLIEDLEGSELADLDAALEEARECVLTMAAERMLAGSPIENDAIEVTDFEGKILGRIRLHNVIMGLLQPAHRLH